MISRSIQFLDWGNIPYKEAWDKQEALLKSIVDIKIANRKLEAHQTPQHTPNYLIFCSHPHVYTLGKTGSLTNLLLNTEQLQEQGIAFFHTNRGGDITYHGPEQVVGYPILDLENFFTDIHRYMRTLEEVIICTLADYGITAERLPGSTGVWLDAQIPHRARKICAMGVKASRWVTMHGWAFNVNTDLSYFNNIIPCGITDKAVTSLHLELGVKHVNMEEVKNGLLRHFCRLFEAVPEY
ncbi:MAG TPA: lipoyl(octanoyl) transferase LipB [Chitinophagales bacterium]|nr:lipoyl(octanoyl) transferase LipB [Chitinophagales bacterium]HRK28356.1 lipoyl(octanoyl) transferase LipB [Chitinophagales bacterium]